MGKIQEVKPLKATHTRKYDPENHTLGPVKTTLSE